MIGCPYVSYVSFMIKMEKRCLWEKKDILKRSQYVWIIKVTFQIFYISRNELKKKREALLYYTQLLSAYIRAYVEQRLWNIHLGTERLGEAELVPD